MPFSIYATTSRSRLYWLSAALIALAAVVSIAFFAGRGSTLVAQSIGGGDETLLVDGQKTAVVSTTTKNGQKPELSSKPSIIEEIKEKKEEWPTLSSLVREDDGEIVADVQFLLDFAIVGHSKTGTSSQMNWLAKHAEVQMYHHEVHSLRNGKPKELVELMYALPSGRQFKRGYKSPNDIVNAISMEAIRTYWPKTKLIVGIRHPVKWFERYANP